MNNSGGTISYSGNSGSGSNLQSIAGSSNQFNSGIGKLEFIFTDATNDAEVYSAFLYID